MFTDNKPSCFGKLWDKECAECAGGLDPAYSHPRTGSHIRQVCDYYSSCGARAQLSKYRTPEKAPSFTAGSQHIRVNIPNSDKPVMFTPEQQRQLMVHQQMMPVNYQMPSYLTVPEHVGEGDTFFHVLFREMLRGMGKSFGHTIAHFFDAHSFDEFL